MRGWQELNVADTIYEEEEEDEDESFNSLYMTSAFTPTPSPPHSSLLPPPSLQCRVEEWTQATGLKTNVVVRVHKKCFLLHKERLITHSGYFKRRLTENADVTVSPPSRMTAETFAEVAFFCYGGDVALTPLNFAALRVAAEWLEMAGDAEAGLIRRAEGYFFREVATDAGRAAAVLRSCAGFLGGPAAEAAAAAEVAVRCAEVLAESGDGGGGWLQDVAALSAEEFGWITKSMRARHEHDNDLLYTVVDHYLHNHDGKLTEEEKGRICYNINCSKLSHHLLVHLVKNPRLPLRFVVQAMLIEQLHTRRCIVDRPAAPLKPHYHRRNSSNATNRSHGNHDQLTLGAIIHRDAARRQAAHIRAAMEATNLRIRSLERDLANLRQQLRWSEEKQDSMRSASFRIARPRDGGLEEGKEVVEASGASCDGHPARSGTGLGQKLVHGLKNMFRKADSVEEGNGSSVGRGGGGDGEVMEVEKRPGHRRSRSSASYN